MSDPLDSTTVARFAEQVRTLVAARTPDEVVPEALASLGRLLGADRVLFGDLRVEGWTGRFEWCAPGIASQESVESTDPGCHLWGLERLRRNEPVLIARVVDIPDDGAVERARLDKLGVRSLLVLPVRQVGDGVTLLGLHFVRTERALDDGVLAFAGLVAAASASLYARLEVHERQQALGERAWRLQHVEILSRVARGAAVELNNRFAVVAGTVDELLAASKAGAAPDPAVVREGLERIARTAERGRELVGRFLSATQPEQGGARVVDLSQEVLALDEVLRATLDEHVVLKLDLTKEPCRAIVDPRVLSGVVIELVANAHAAMRRGGTVTVRTRCVHGDGGTKSVLEVQDDGPGFSEEAKLRAFEPFFTTHPAGTAFGLGLPMIARGAAAAGGDVEVAPLDGAGALLRVSLPATEAEVEPRSEGAPVFPPARGERVLIVEDDPMLRETLRRLLDAHGYAVLQASDALEALAAAEAEPSLDLLVTDVFLPVGSGTSLARSLRRRRPDLPVLLISARSSDPRATDGLETRARFLPKPFGRAELLSAVRQTLDSED